MSSAPAARTLSSRARLSAAALIVATGTFALAAAIGDRAGFSPSLGTTAAGIFLLVMAIAVGGIGGHHPFPHLGPANWITIVRTALVAFVAALIVEPRGSLVAHACVVVASVAAALDGWDGWIARRTRMSSPFGARFDMEVDALLILLLGVFVWRYEKAGAWVLLSGVLRYLFVLAGWLGH